MDIRAQAEKSREVIGSIIAALQELNLSSQDLYAWDCPAGQEAVQTFCARVSEQLDNIAGHEIGLAMLGDDGSDYVTKVQQVTTASGTKWALEGFARESESQIARGGFGQVFSAKLICAAATDRKRRSSVAVESVPAFDVAVKLVEPASRESGTDTLNEIAIALGIQRESAVRQPRTPSRILPVLHIDLNPRTSQVRLALPLGISDMSRAISYCGAELLPQTRRRWCAELVAGLAEIHTHGVVHGDIKPNNVIVFPITPNFDDAAELHSAVKLALSLRSRATTQLGKTISARALSIVLEFTTLRMSDFGLATFATSEQGGVVVTNTTFPYTAEYRPLEVWCDHRWSHSADIWALGCAIYELTFNKGLFSERRGAPVRLPVSNHARKQAYIKLHERFGWGYDLFSRVGPAMVAPTDQVRRDLGASAPSDFVRCTFQADEWNTCDPLLRNFIASMLQLSPASRLSSTDLLEHPYIASHSAARERFAGGAVIPTLDLPALAALAASAAASGPPFGDTTSGVKTDGGADGLLPRGVTAFQEYETSPEPRILALQAACKSAAPFDPLVQSLGTWLLAKEVGIHKKSRSIRIRRIDLETLAAACCRIAAKVLLRHRSVGTIGLVADVSPRDERSICEQLDFELFPFREAIMVPP